MLEREHQLLRECADALRFEFIVLELKLGITFCEVAACTRDADRSRRNITLAEDACSSAKHFFGAYSDGYPMRRTLEAKLFELESLLRKLQRRR